MVLFPELGLCGYSLQDLLHQQPTLRASLEALRMIVELSTEVRPAIVVSLPLRIESSLAVTAVVVHDGTLLGAVPKSFLPNYREYYEKRHFAPAASFAASEAEILGQRVPFGSLLFEVSNVADFCFGLEICEDLWSPLPPSTWLAMAGATVIGNPSASNATVSKADYRRVLCASQSGRCIAGYLYAGAGEGESTTDLAWDGHAMIWENGVCLAESRRFESTGSLLLADIDVERLAIDRMRMTSFQDGVVANRERVAAIRRVAFDLDLPHQSLVIERQVDRFPYVPSDPSRRDERCEEVYNIQVHGLCQRLRASGIDKVVIGVSGDWTRPMPCWWPFAPWRSWNFLEATFSPTRCPVSRPANAPRRTPSP